MAEPAEPQQPPPSPNKPGWGTIIVGILGIALLLAISLFIGGLGEYR